MKSITRCSASGAAVLLFLCAAGCSHEVAAARRDASTASANLMTAAEFVRNAGQAGIFEVESAELALQKPSSDTVRAIARRLRDDHSKANAELLRLAGDKGLEAPQGPSAMQQATLERLGGLTGTEFDEQFVVEQRQAHRQAIDLFERVSRSLGDGGLQGFASRTLPTLREHAALLDGRPAPQPQSDAGRAGDQPK